MTQADTASQPGDERSLSMDDKRTFGRQGYVVAPQVVPPEAVQAAMMAVDELLRGQPLPEEHRGHWSYWLRDADHQTFLPLLMDSPAFGLAGNLVGPEALEAPDFTQIALCIPPWRHRPGGPHLDGLSSAKPGAPPDSFTLLVGILLTDQPDEDMGNLWVWPGTHRQYAGWLRQHGPDALVGSEPAPPIQLPPPCQVVGRAGDVILAHYLLGHNIGGNTSDVVRRVAYFRLQAAGHRERWREVVQDEFREFEPVLRAE